MQKRIYESLKKIINDYILKIENNHTAYIILEQPAFGVASGQLAVFYENEKVLVLCDIEGAEEELLDPDLAPALRKLDIIVESHECLRPGITQKLLSRFEATHTIELIEDNGSRQLDNPPAWFAKLSHLDQLLATWEWRSGPTPWLVMRAKG